jgi:ABC-type multidrug transport system fused ATPase/permease subunit
MNEPIQPSTLSSFKTLLGASWQATRGDRMRLFGFASLYVLAYSTDLAVPWAIAWILGVFVQKGLTPEAFSEGLKGIGVYVALKMAAVAFHHFGRFVQGLAGYNARFNKLEQVFTALISFPLKWHVHHHTGENLSKLHRSVGAIEAIVANYSWQIIDGVIRFFGATLLLFALDVEVAITVLVMGTLTVLVMILFNSRLTRNIRKNNRFYDRLNRTCVDYLSNIITVKTLRLEHPAISYLVRQRDEGFRLRRKIAKYEELKWGTIAVGYSLVMGASLFVYFNNQRYLGTAFDIAKVYVLLDYLNRIFAAIGSFTGYYGGIIQEATAYEDASSVIDESQPLPDPTRLGNLPRDWSSVILQNVTFSYGGDVQNLKHVTVPVLRGEKIALVGPSGGGKSTLLKVMAGMLAVEEGNAATPDGTTYSLDDVAQVSLLVPQEPEVFSESVRYNLSFGENYSDQELQRAVEVCRIDHILQKLSRGWETQLEEAGLNISVGERQRLALARGILRVPGKDILLLDEPTSSLDPMTEKQIFAGILHEFRDLTVITACHRLALVPLFDKVIYVKDGRVEEIGSFPELRAAGRGFSAAWSDYERTVTSSDGGAAA